MLIRKIVANEFAAGTYEPLKDLIKSKRLLYLQYLHSFENLKEAGWGRKGLSPEQFIYQIQREKYQK